jgi:peptidyl-prolyl cis-trans isomerase D
MLTAIRRSVSGFFSKLLMLFLIITFAVWGVGDMVRGGITGRTLVSVGDTGISDQEFLRELAQVRERMGTELPPELLDSEMLRAQVLNRMIQMRLLQLAAQDLGLAVGEQLIARQTMENPMFQTVDGRFDAKGFTAFLAAQQLTEAGYAAIVADETLERLLLNSSDLDQFRLPEAYLTLNALTRHQERRATLITINAAVPENASEEDLRRYYDAIKEQEFLRPETRTLIYAILSKEALKDKSEEARVELGYQIEDALAAGDSIPSALRAAGVRAQERSLKEVAADGTLKSGGKVADTAVMAAVLQQGFQLSEGDASGLLTAADGTYFLVRVGAVQAAEPAPFEAVKGEVATRYRAEAAQDDARRRAEELKARLVTAKDEAARKALLTDSTLKVRDSGWLKKPAGTRPAPAGIPAVMMADLFAAKKNQPLGPVMLKDGSAMLALLRETRVPEKVPTVSASEEKAQLAELADVLLDSWYRSLVVRHPVTQHHAIPNPGSGTQ